jgi:hypothetical protein
MPKEKVADKDIMTAFYNWQKYPHDDPGKSFMKYLEVNHIRSALGTSSVDSGAAHKIRMLLGPHYLTIIKAWYAKQEA